MSGLLRDYLKRHVEEELREQGFDRHGYLFTNTVESHASLIYFHRSDESCADRTVFTVELGVWSKWLHSFFKMYEHPFIASRDFANNLSYADCHWRERLSFLFARPRDVWWTLSKSENSVVLGELRQSLVGVGIPKLRSLMSDRSLLEEFANGRPREVTVSERLFYVTALLVRFGRTAELEERIAELRRVRKHPEFQRAVMEHVRALSSLRPPVPSGEGGTQGKTGEGLQSASGSGGQALI